MAAAVLLVMIISAVSIVFGKESVSSTEPVSVGDRFLSDPDFKQAVAEYKAQLEIDPKDSEARENLVETYDKWALTAAGEGDYALAGKILRLGFSDTHSPDLVWEIAKISLRGLGLGDIYEQAKGLFGL